ncbi:unnamed protein product [Trichogramma brassicae]|uniref:Uncharacterized protein n=1 Tax=Trichogramma brassicae TaxID=86971 RepID=A0A6H5II94_9HYME|nr:unnamed protein product [Trichogramma brassicae]
MTTTTIISYTCSRTTTTTTTLFSGGPSRESHLTDNESNIQQNESHCTRSCWYLQCSRARGESAQRSRRIGADRRVTATAPPPPLLATATAAAVVVSVQLYSCGDPEKCVRIYPRGSSRRRRRSRWRNIYHVYDAYSYFRELFPRIRVHPEIDERQRARILYIQRAGTQRRRRKNILFRVRGELKPDGRINVARAEKIVNIPMEFATLCVYILITGIHTSVYEVRFATAATAAAGIMDRVDACVYVRVRRALVMREESSYIQCIHVYAYSRDRRLIFRVRAYYDIFPIRRRKFSINNTRETRRDRVYLYRARAARLLARAFRRKNELRQISAMIQEYIDCIRHEIRYGPLQRCPTQCVHGVDLHSLMLFVVNLEEYLRQATVIAVSLANKVQRCRPQRADYIRTSTSFKQDLGRLFVA